MFVFQERLAEIAFGYGIRLTDLGGGDRLNALHWQSPAGTLSPPHAHPEEQFGYLLSGSVEVTIGEEKELLQAGDCYFIPGGTPHQFRMLEDSVVIDIFSPRRPVPEPLKEER